MVKRIARGSNSHAVIRPFLLSFGDSKARDVIQAFKDAALRVKMKITETTLGNQVDFPLILPSDYAKALDLRRRLDLLLPHPELSRSKQILEQYWKRFRDQFGADHGVFAEVPEADLPMTIPVKVHGNEGRSAWH